MSERTAGERRAYSEGALAQRLENYGDELAEIKKTITVISMALTQLTAAVAGLAAVSAEQNIKRQSSLSMRQANAAIGTLVIGVVALALKTFGVFGLLRMEG